VTLSLTVEWSPTTAPLAATPTWQTITGVRSVAIRRGRGDELDTFREGTADLVIDNRTRAWEPEYASSPWYPNVVPNRRLRIRRGSDVVFDGFIDAVQPSYTVNKDAYVTVSCTDLTKFLARYQLKVEYVREVAADTPVHWWRLGEAKGEALAHDDGSSSADGRYGEGAALGDSPIALTETTSSMGVGGAGTATILLPKTTLSDFTVEFLVADVATRDDGSGTSDWTNPVTLSGPSAGLNIGVGANLGASVHVAGVLDSGSIITGSLGNFDGPKPQHVAFSYLGGSAFAYYLNGVLLELQLVAGAITVDRLILGSLSTRTTARIAHVAVYGASLSPTRIAAHAAAARAPWEGDTPGARVGRMCDLVGVPAGMRNIDTGETGPLAAVREAMDGKSALDHARLVEVTEQGRMFADKTGRWTLLRRRSDYGATSAATLGDSTGEIPYVELEQSFDEQGLVTRATVTRQGGNPQAYGDATADATFTLDRSGVLYASDNESMDAATWTVIRHKTPTLRFRRLTLLCHKSSTVMTQCVTRDIGDVVTVRRRPPGGGAAQEKTLVIEGVEHQVDAAGQTWATTWQLSPADPGRYLRLDDPTTTLDSTAMLAF
jgi:hypothetical protein